jgi:hypothetical protein
MSPPAGWLSFLSGSSRDSTGRAARAGARGRVPQRVGERKIGHGVAELCAPAGQHREPALAGASSQLGDEAGLADPGVTADQRDDRAAGGRRLEHPHQMAELCFPAD